MNGHLSKIALASCLILLLVACNQIGTPALTDETVSPAVATPPGVNEQIESVSPPTQLPTTMVEPTESQQEAIISLSPTKAIAEDHAMNELQKQLPLGDESTDENVELARQDLAQRLRVSVDSITVTAVIGQEFSTDAFHCRTTKERIAKEEFPQVVSGYSILLSVSGRMYEYHASGQTVIFCQPLP